jgi:quercetin dioxygenase-like cupin family protein
VIYGSNGLNEPFPYPLATKAQPFSISLPIAAQTTFGIQINPALSTPSIHVVKSGKGRHRASFGVSFDLLAIGPASMSTQMHYRIGNLIPFHAHPNEQAGYILSGKVRVLTRDSYVIPAGIEHSIVILEDAEELQCFSPPRADFL